MLKLETLFYIRNLTERFIVKAENLKLLTAENVHRSDASVKRMELKFWVQNLLSNALIWVFADIYLSLERCSGCYGCFKCLSMFSPEAGVGHLLQLLHWVEDQLQVGLYFFFLFNCLLSLPGVVKRADDLTWV